MSWEVWSSPEFDDGLAFIRNEVEKEGQDLEEELANYRSKSFFDDEPIRNYLLRKRDWAFFENAIKDFENQYVDPDNVLQPFVENGVVLDNFYYKRISSFYAIYERDPVDRKTIGITVYEQRSRFFWFTEMWRRYFH